jgi:hypothetical protein
MAGEDEVEIAGIGGHDDLAADRPLPWQSQSLGRGRQHPAEGLPQAAIRPRHHYQDLGADYYERQRDTRRQIAHHVGKLGALGFEVTLCRIPEPSASAGTLAA